MTLFFLGASSRGLRTAAPLLLFLATFAAIHFAQASPFRAATPPAYPPSQSSLSSISNMASMKGYLTPRCTRSSASTSISLQDCYGALSQLPFNVSDSLALSRPVSQSANTCSLTVSKVMEKNADPGDQESLVNVYEFLQPATWDIAQDAYTR